MIKVKEFSKRIAIILLIAVFSIAGIVSCSTDVTEPNVSQTTEPPDPGQTGPVTPGDTNVTPEPGDTNTYPEPEPEPTPTFPKDTYYRVYVPFRGEDYSRVSYEDTNALLQYWKEMIGVKDEPFIGSDRGESNKRWRFFITYS